MSKHLPFKTPVSKALTATLATPVALFAGFTAVSYLGFRRSNIATASEIYNRVTGMKDKMADPIEWDNFILQRSELNEQRYTMPTLMSFKVSVEDTDLHGCQTFLLNRRNINDRAVIYIHGRGLIDRPSLYQWRFLDTLARKTRAQIIVPMYPLAPVHTHEEVFALLEDIYRDTVAKYGADSVTLMGDAAGGGIAAAFAQSLPERGLEQPAHLILISPWLDLTLGNPDIPAYDLMDPMASAAGLRKVARVWAGGKDLADPLLSPINGPVRHLRNVMTIVGTRELMYPDAALFHQRVRAAGVNAELVVGRGLNNDYPYYPIPEASRAVEKIVSAISMD